MFTLSSGIILVLVSLPVIVLQAVLRVDRRIWQGC